MRKRYHVRFTLLAPVLVLSAGAIPAGADPPGIRLLSLADGSHVVDIRELLFNGVLRALSLLPCDEGKRGVP